MNDIKRMFLEAVKTLPFIGAENMCSCFLEEVFFVIIGKTNLEDNEIRRACEGALEKWHNALEIEEAEDEEGD
jgi:hypothetical protein